MKVTQEKAVFQPVYIVLETQEEVDRLRSDLEIASNSLRNEFRASIALRFESLRSALKDAA